MILLEATINGAQANNGDGTGSGGTGTASLSYDNVTKDLSWNIQWSSLSGTATAAHFHGPAIPTEGAGVQLGIGVGANPAVGNATLSSAQEIQLLDELWYINIHSTSFGGGEIRGQVLLSPVPEPSAFAFLGIAGVLFAGYRIKRRRP